ncbi:TPA: hypothetical protein ACGF4W_002506 [Vibrio cholerae]
MSFTTWEKLYNKRFKRDSQRVAFLLCVGICGYSIMLKVCGSVVCPLSGRYGYQIDFITNVDKWI